MNFSEARAQWAADAPRFRALGVEMGDVQMYTPDGWKSNWSMAMDAQPALTTASGAAIPAFLATLIDPEVFRVLFAPNKMAEIVGEVKKGTWIDDTAIFPLIENTGEVSSYGDYNENGSAGLNLNWPQRQAYIFQTLKQYGDRELERAGLAKINFVSEIDVSAALALNKFLNLTYAFGVSGLQNYGLLNDPNLTASLTPATKAAGGTAWINSSGQIVATANEIYADIQALFYQLVKQSSGLIEKDDALTLAMSPGSHVALTATNSFGVNVSDLLKKNFPSITIKTAVQYGASSTSNPQGVAAGNFVQLIATAVEGQKSGYCAFNEKMRSHPIVRLVSAYKQKLTGGTWGAIIRQPFAIANMVGV
jgi:hypothetical protein